LNKSTKSNGSPSIPWIEEWFDRLKLVLDSHIAANQSGFFAIPEREETYVGLLASALPQDAIWLIEQPVRKRERSGNALVDGRRDLWVSHGHGLNSTTYSVEAKHQGLDLDASVSELRKNLTNGLKLAVDDARRVPPHARTDHNFAISFRPLFWDGYRTANGIPEQSAADNLDQVAVEMDGRNRFHRIYMGPSETWSRIASSTWPGLLVIGQKIDRV